MIDELFPFLLGLAAFVYGCLQFRQAQKPLTESRYPFVRTKNRPLRIAAAVWIWIVAALLVVASI